MDPCSPFSSPPLNSRLPTYIPHNPSPPLNSPISPTTLHLLSTYPSPPQLFTSTQQTHLPNPSSHPLNRPFVPTPLHIHSAGPSPLPLHLQPPKIYFPTPTRSVLFILFSVALQSLYLFPVFLRLYGEHRPFDLSGDRPCDLSGNALHLRSLLRFRLARLDVMPDQRRVE